MNYFWLFALLLPALAVAQSRTAEINGRVTDPSGGAVVDARITVRNLETGAVRNAATGGSGDYTASPARAGQL